MFQQRQNERHFQAWSLKPEEGLMTGEEIQKILKRCELFQSLSEKDIESVSALCLLERFEAGEPVFQQGDFGDRLYIIAEGQVALERKIDLGTRKGSAVMGLLGAGRAFGCWSTLLDDAHNHHPSVRSTSWSR